MLVPGDLGFRVATFFIFVVFPAIGFIIRRKWRLAVARKKEINRLLVLASELEAARVELDATIGYTAAVPAPLYFQCTVCFVPASNRCARCKLVYYWEYWRMYFLHLRKMRILMMTMKKVMHLKKKILKKLMVKNKMMSHSLSSLMWLTFVLTYLLGRSSNVYEFALIV